MVVESRKRNWMAWKSASYYRNCAFRNHQTFILWHHPLRGIKYNAPTRYKLWLNNITAEGSHPKVKTGQQPSPASIVASTITIRQIAHKRSFWRLVLNASSSIPRALHKAKGGSKLPDQPKASVRSSEPNDCRGGQ